MKWIDFKYINIATNVSAVVIFVLKYSTKSIFYIRFRLKLLITLNVMRQNKIIFSRKKCSVLSKACCFLLIKNKNIMVIVNYNA